MSPAESSVTPGISLLPRFRGPIPDRNSRSPTRLACGNAPTGSGARGLSKLWDICALLLSPYSGRGRVRGLHFVAAHVHNLLKHGIDVFEHVRIDETNHTISQGFENHRAIRVALRGCDVSM